MHYDKKSFERYLISVTPRHIVAGLRKAKGYGLVLEYLLNKQNSYPSVFPDLSRPVFNQEGPVRVWTSKEGYISEIECDGKRYK